ncbi:hypothetical protein [Listeria phage P100plus]|uniref:Uncharacterized protein n=4 Tax=Pecentumvirus TaxID=1857844 RepID=A0A6H2A8I4_9CAUD|nr:hypothetical protein PI27_gp021 [Listeria phage WIL-1]YP_406543.1 gp167 [Listeria phage P100]QJB22439.1 hypothetical protein [Listeria phage P100plus]QJB22629.1 hypothetical protein [Listeria phage P200]AAY53470.1 gp167 [Listeria phage P100]AIM49871.1 hypothetical protein [Listeria phage WIL-1]
MSRSYKKTPKSKADWHSKERRLDKIRLNKLQRSRISREEHIPDGGFYRKLVFRTRHGKYLSFQQEMKEIESFIKHVERTTKPYSGNVVLPISTYYILRVHEYTLAADKGIIVTDYYMNNYINSMIENWYRKNFRK